MIAPARPSLRVYVAAPYHLAPEVRDLHARLRTLGLRPSSAWAEAARGDLARERLDMAPALLRSIAEQNDRDLAGSDVVLVLSQEFGGRETYAEARYALTRGISVLWVGEPTLSAFRSGVRRFADLESAIEALTNLATAIGARAVRS